MSLQSALANNAAVRWLYQNLFVTGDNVRLATQLPALRAVLPPRADYALDAGAGSGEYTRRLLLPRASRVAAMDLDGNALRRLRSRLGPRERERCRLARASVAEIPYRTASFDLVLLCEVLEHCVDDGGVLDEVARVLRPGGTLVIAVPVPPAPYADGAHVREGYTLDALLGLLSERGFTVEEHRFCMFRLSRAILRLRTRFPFVLPLALVGLIERWLTSGREEGSLPFDVVVRATRQPDPPSRP